MALLSIIVPVYMSENYIYKCVNSILEQTFHDFELILVDDGSMDNCPEILDRYMKKDSRIKVLHQRNSGPISARKAGIIAATGKYVSFIDSDDWIEKNMFEKMLECTLEYDCDVTVCDSYIEFDSKTEVNTQKITPGYYDKTRLQKEVYTQLIYSKKFKKYNLSPTLWNKIFKKSVVEKYINDANENIRVGEDAVICYPAVLNSESLYYVNIPFYHYRINPNAITRTYDRYFFNRMKLLFTSLEKHFEGFNMDEQFYIYKALLIVQGVRNEVENHDLSMWKKAKKLGNLKQNYSFFKSSLDKVKLSCFEFDIKIWIIILRYNLILIGIFASKVNFLRRKMRTI